MNEFISGTQAHNKMNKINTHICRQWRRNDFEHFSVVPLHFLALKIGERFRDGQYSLSVSCSLFFFSQCPRAQPFVKVGARASRAP